MAIKASVKGTKVITGKVRLSFVNLFTPRAQNEGGAPKYSVLLLIPKSDTATIEAIEKAQKTALEEAKAKGKFGGKTPKAWKSTLRDGDEEKDLDDYPEYEGQMFMTVSANEAYPPKVVDTALQPILDQSEVYSGCYARVSINAFAFDIQGNKGVSFGLNNVQKLADGEPLGGVAAKPEDDFEALDDDEELI